MDKKFNNKPNEKVHYTIHFDRKIGSIIWTLMWLIFIGILCYKFNSAMPLWLLIPMEVFKD